MKNIKVFSASALDAQNRKKIEASFAKKHVGEELSFSYEIDVKLIGGVLIIDGADYYDASVKGQLSALKKADTDEHKVSAKNKNKAKPIAPGEIIADEGFLAVLNDFKPQFSSSRAGTVIFSGDGVVKIQGLQDAKYGELLDIEGSVMAIALNLEENEVGAIVLADDDKVSSGMIVHTTGRIVEVPVGEELLGRVVNSLGVPVDGMGELVTTKKRPIEAHAPEIVERGKVNQPLQTGILAIDSMIPIGKGQRELIIGDRQTGKTAIAIDTIINQKDKNVMCIYVAIGQKASTISNVMHTLAEHGAMDYTTIVCSTARDSSPMQYIAPFAGCAMAEELMYQGKDVLIVYDDLTKHAVAYRAMSLLLKRPPGREAYPGDIFYLHSRLLERAAKLSAKKGGGSITALPIVETLAGDISAYIPTNIISITDGQIYLEQELFNAGIRPAVNVGLSVSRVGSSAQIKAMKSISGKLRLDLSQYRELAVFAQFGSDLDTATSAMLEQGERTTESLKQELNSPLDIEHQIIILYITIKEFLKKIPVKKIREFNKGFLEYVQINYQHIIDNIHKTKELGMEDCLDIEDAVKQYSDYFFKLNA
ncbi:atp synthase subunit alpha mitochondrial [Holotrichia oblita]|nr:atp synthase subunit alpha mitochondrial [Holotrichia oblita]